MPKCTPGSGEKQNEFVSRCIKQARDDGKPEDEAQGMCYGIWNETKKSLITKALSELVKVFRG